MASRQRASRADAFERVSGMPLEYFQRLGPAVDEADIRALRVFLALRTAARRVENVVSGWLDRTGVTPTKLDTLHLIASAGASGATTGGLREKLRMTQPNVTYVVQALERDGLVKRSRHRDDRRVFVLTLTKAGDALIAATTSSHVEAIGTALAAIGAREADRFIETLAAVTEAFERAALPIRLDG